MIKIYSHPTAVFVHHMKNVLNNHGIRSEVMRESISKNLDGLATNSWVELWLIDENRAKEAKKIVDSTIDGDQPNSKKQSATWKCPHCEEAVGAEFAICWNCQTERPES